MQSFISQSHINGSSYPVKETLRKCYNQGNNVENGIKYPEDVVEVDEIEHESKPSARIEESIPPMIEMSSSSGSGNGFDQNQTNHEYDGLQNNEYGESSFGVEESTLKPVNITNQYDEQNDPEPNMNDLATEGKMV